MMLIVDKIEIIQSRDFFLSTNEAQLWWWIIYVCKPHDTHFFHLIDRKTIHNRCR